MKRRLYPTLYASRVAVFIWTLLQFPLLVYALSVHYRSEVDTHMLLIIFSAFYFIGGALWLLLTALTEWLYARACNPDYNR